MQNVEIPSNLPKINPAPKGYRWVYRGVAWHSKVKVKYVYYDMDQSYWTYGDLHMLSYANGGRNIHYVELVSNSIEEQLEYCRSLIGKKITYKNGMGHHHTCCVDAIDILLKGKNSSLDVENVADRDGVCVFVKSGVFSIPFENIIEIVPAYKELKLNDQYTAKVYKDKVEVGCQTFTIKQVKEILNLSEGL